jgi:predicted molibdopterin-dependent oxidoreductase YjgC
MCDEGRLTYHDLREHRLVVATVDGLPKGWDRSVALAAELIRKAADAGTLAVSLSATCSNEDNFALARLAAKLGLKSVAIAGRPNIPSRADGKLRTADVNANRAGAKTIAEALGLLITTDAGDARTVIALGDEAPSVPELIAMACHDRKSVTRAKVALPIAAWAEIGGTVTNHAGRVQRMHAAFPPPGQAVAGWEAVARVGAALGHPFAWTHPREVFTDMTAAVATWRDAKWAREVRPLQLRFAGSRG